MNGIVSRLSALSKAGLGLAAGALALIILNLALPGSSLFFPLVSLWLDLALFLLALVVLRVAGVELDLFHRAVLAGVWAAALLYAFWALGIRTTRAEVDYYLSGFAQEDALYPEMFSQVAEAWLTGHGL